MTPGQHLGTVGELSFSVSLNEDGGVDLPLAPDGRRCLAIDYEHRDVCGFILCGFERDAVPGVCWDIIGFFEANKETLSEKALSAVRGN